MKPMLAGKSDLAKLNYPVYASAKLDGVRALVIAGKLKSRSLKPIPNPYVNQMFARVAFNHFDGELILGSPTAEDVYRQTVSAVSRHEGTPDVKFHVFDYIDTNRTYLERQTILRGLARIDMNIVLVNTVRIDDERQLLEYEDFKVSEGYEGLILRSPDGLYKYGRSSTREGGMLKLKRFVDAEAEIISVYEELANTNEAKTNALGRTERSTAKAGKQGKGRAGGFEVRDVKTSKTFRVGTGLNDAERVFAWENRDALPGKIIKYKSFPVGVKEKPRHPVYLGAREEWDL